MEGQDPFALRKKEKKLETMKQKKREIKNEENRKSFNGKKKSEQTDDGINRSLEKTEKSTHSRKNKKLAAIEKEKNRLKADKKGLEKKLETGNFFKNIK